jgi:carbohydrate esterase-like sialic acid-specific acetylesterase
MKIEPNQKPSVQRGPRPFVSLLLTLLLPWIGAHSLGAQEDSKTLRVFIFAGQSNMVGSDSKTKDIERFPPFAGLEKPQNDVKFSYCIGRENKRKSDGWVPLEPVNGVVGPELSFAREIKRHSKAPIAIIKVAAGGTHLAGDWNPDEPRGFKMYPLALDWVRAALADLDRRKIKYRLEGFVWHQGENDMFEEGAMPVYGANLKNFLASWRRDLKAPKLRFYIGELCTNTIWGMDMRPRMYAISVGQRQVTDTDPLADYVPTSHVGVEIGNPVGLHYHYGTLGQLEHGVNHATAYLRNIGKEIKSKRPLKNWPYAPGSKVKLFVLAGHRNMEGERAFVQELKSSLRKDNHKIAFKYSLGGGYKVSDGWEPLGPAGSYDTFGPELSFGSRLQTKLKANVAIAKFTHSGTQMIDWTLEGSEAKSRNIYPSFLTFVRDSIQQLTEQGHEVELAGIFYHLSENDMSMNSYRNHAIDRLASLVAQSRKDLALPELKWFVSQQPPTDHENLNAIDVIAELEKLAAVDPSLIHIKAFDLPGSEQKLVITTQGIVKLGKMLADSYLKQN